MVGLKKMFFPANEKAKSLMDEPEFGPVALARLQYPQSVPILDDLERYRAGEPVTSTMCFLDHLCHPAALLVLLLGMPETLFYQRSSTGAGLATFTFPGGAIASLALTAGQACNGGMERTVIVSARGRHITVDNNIRVTYHRDAPTPEGQNYGSTPNFFTGDAGETTASWEPEFSLGQLYNKGLFLLGYAGEIDEFAKAVLEDRPFRKGHLEHAWQVTRIFEAFVEGPGKVIELG